jgi:hypothetical protein
MFKRILGVALAAALALTVVGAMPASAKAGDVVKKGPCSAGAEWKLKLSPEDGKIEVEYEVDSNVNGQRWNVKIFQNGSRIFNGHRTTQGASGSFTVRLVTPDGSGTDAFRAKATNAGQTCAGKASF